jgi:hypothetical protein
LPTSRRVMSEYISVILSLWTYSSKLES